MSGRTISVDQTIFGMTRIMSTCMAISEAAGVAAVLACENNISPSALNVAEVRLYLEKQGAVIR